ncbi:unnamed protein product [Camellia sinensis]
MERLIWLFQFLLFFMQYHQVSCSSSVSSFSTCTQHLCPHDQRFALLQFKHMFTLESSASLGCGDLASPKMLSWNESCTDCCSWEGVTCDGLTGHVIGLDLSCSQLHGSIHPNSSLFQLSHLQNLNLAFNHFNYFHIPSAFGQFASLTHLNLSYSSFSGSIPSEIRHLSKLVSLDLSCSEPLRLEPHNFRMMLQNQTQLHRSLGNLTQITHIYLRGNSFNGQIPFTLSNLNQLINFNLFGINLDGKIPNFIGKLIKLEVLALGDNNFNGPFPCGVANLTKLGILDISSSAVMGPIPSIMSGLHNLQALDLHNNSLNGTLPSWLLNLPSLTELNLGSNRLTGQIPEFQHKSKLMYIDLSHNELHGPIPQSISNLVNLTKLVLSSNNFSGVVELETFLNLKNLDGLDLSYNGLSVSTINNINNTLPNLRFFHMTSCKIKEFPDFFKALENVEQLDTSNNEIRGKIPKWVGVMGRLHCGQLPAPPLSVSYFLFSENKLTGEIPSTICNVSSLSILDLSHNNFSDLQFNAFQGNIPMIFGKGNQLEILNLNGNQFEGLVPRSLTNCRQLKVLDLENNKINDTFPYWLGTLPELWVLVLRSNKFHGPIDNSKPNLSFPKLRIVDISHNNFIGYLPGRYFKFFEAMRNKTMPNEKYLSVRSYYQASIAVTMKGSYIDLTRIFTLFTAIDLSSNKFSGDIPNVIGRLTSLIVLNLSHNSLTGLIPSSLGDLIELESLDLSSNQLIGKIPNHLLSLTFLGVFNLSWNHLDGPIPWGKQFDTFGNDSYVGNSGLCGFLLSKECKDNQSQVQPGVLFKWHYGIDDNIIIRQHTVKWWAKFNVPRILEIVQEEFPPDQCAPTPALAKAQQKLTAAITQRSQPSLPPVNLGSPSSSGSKPKSFKSKSKAVAAQPALSKPKSKSKVKAKPISPPAQPKVKSKNKSKSSKEDMIQLAHQLLNQAKTQSTDSDSSEKGSEHAHSSEESTNQCSGPEFQDAQDPSR